jgi:hypothetical protein
MDLFAQLSNIITLFTLLSVAVERATAIAIVLTKLDERITDSKFNGMAKQLIATLLGAFIYMISPDTHLQFIDKYFTGLTGPFIIGLAASGGSGFWNQLLKLLAATTVAKKSEITK